MEELQHSASNGGFDQEEEAAAAAAAMEEEEASVAGPSRPATGSRRKKQKPLLIWEHLKLEQDKWLDDNMWKDSDLDTTDEVMTESAEAPSDLVGELLGYQKEWLAWALKQESSEIRGGILADEMGMGKTLQAIALVLSKREPSTELGEASSPPGLRRTRATLVICLSFDLMQWVSEIEKFTAKGSTKVLVYNGPKREQLSEKFSEYDFVITTHAIVEAEFARHLVLLKEMCPDYHEVYHPTSMHAQKQPMYTGKESSAVKEVHLAALRKNSPLHSVMWERIILDEAHSIRVTRSCIARDVLALESMYRWALSSTPIRNLVDKIYSMIRFLRMDPYSFYFCKACDCRVLDPRSGECWSCPHSSAKHFNWWTKFVDGRINQKRQSILLKHKIMKSVLLRRTKKGRAADLELPPLIVSLRRDALDVRERNYYEAVYKDCQEKYDIIAPDRTIPKDRTRIFPLLTRLRQAVNHMYLVQYSGGANQVNIADAAPELLCDICHEQPEDRVVTACEHVFCKACLLGYPSSSGERSCPSCSKIISVNSTKKTEGRKSRIEGFKASSIIHRIERDDFITSTKIEALREEIRCMAERNGSAKGIVFSQFPAFLDLIKYSLQKSDVKCVELIEGMTIKARDHAINEFTEDPDCKIFLMTLKNGGVVHNLTVASHVFLMDPCWNPRVEQKVLDSIHMIGQYIPIRITKFIIENTVEEQILKIQEEKKRAIERWPKSSGELVTSDLMFLFGSDNH